MNSVAIVGKYTEEPLVEEHQIQTAQNTLGEKKNEHTHV